MSIVCQYTQTDVNSDKVKSLFSQLKLDYLNGEEQKAYDK